jgi:RNA-directed DNA polymerase
MKRLFYPCSSQSKSPRVDLAPGATGSLPAGKPSLEGAVVSPLLSNIYLDGLDWQMAKGGFEMVRYADDFIVLCASQQQAQEALERVGRWVEENGLSLHPVKTRLVDASQAGGFDFPRVSF